MSPPIPLEEAQARLLALAEPLTIERTDVPGALGRYLAEPLVARRTQPACDLSAMDGYAVRADDLAGPWRVVGESAAGHPFGAGIGAGEAVRIATGAALPPGAGSVIVQEDVTRDGAHVAFAGLPPVPSDKHVRRTGMDFVSGDTLLGAGTRLGPAQLALAIAAGATHLPVRRAARVTVIDSGDELTDDAENCAAHQIPASNGVMLAAMIAGEPADVRRLGPVADNPEALLDAFAAAADADVIVTSGGASVGDHDLIRPTLAASGAQIAFWRIAIRPGKPLLVATRESARGRQIVLGLPGNPVSSHVTAHLFLLPLLRALAGAAGPLPRAVSGRLDAALPATEARRTFVRARWDGSGVVPLANQDSSALATLAQSNALIDRPARSPAGTPGEAVNLFLLGNGGVA